MTYRRAAIPALVGGLFLAALLWWAGASAAALHLPGSSRVLGTGTARELEHWLAPWSYDPPGADGAGDGDGDGDGGGYAVGTGDSARYLSLYETAIQIRFGAVFAFFVPGALLLVRRLPPLRGRAWAALLAVWAWGLVAGMLARAVSAPWLIAGQGHGSYRFLPQIASVISSGAQVLVVAALLAAAATVLPARVTVKGAGPLPHAVVPACAARLAATVGTSLIAVSLVVLSYQTVAAAIQEASTATGLLSDPGDLLRLWLLLGGWAGPEGGSIGSWLLNRVPDVALLAVVWGALRRLPGLLTRVTVPAMAVGAVCATVLGLLASQLLRVLMEAADSGAPSGAPRLFAVLGSGVPAALTWGLVAGVAAAVTLRVVTDRTARAEDA
ncbi:hypothetical protein ACIQV3_40345 [Streptomyces sp. NPDC099050]|uniref:hypothetical protein n=1 Tax=Streptomyces sp. NPDC099050 TaxID=3366100 RepID=UPI0038066820